MKYFDKEEKQLIESFEKGEWVSSTAGLSKYREMAKESLMRKTANKRAV